MEPNLTTLLFHGMCSIGYRLTSTNILNNDFPELLAGETTFVVATVNIRLLNINKLFDVFVGVYITSK